MNDKGYFIRKIAFDALSEIILNNSYSNLTLKRLLNNKDILQIDKNLITEITYGTLKYKYTLDMILENYIKINKTDKRILIILEMSLFQIKYLDKVPDYAIINEAVELSKKISHFYGSFVNAVLRNYMRKRKEVDESKLEKLKMLCFKFSFPVELVKLLKYQYGDKVSEILSSLNEIPKITLRVNNLKIKTEEFIKKLQDEEIQYEISEFCNRYIIIKSNINIENKTTYKEGLISVQNESSMFAAKFLDAGQNHEVLDLCAAPGGKSCFIAESLNNKVYITSCDIHEHRVRLIENNCKRLGITSISTKLLDATKFNDEFINRFDRVLVDVPCSGLGVIRKKPELKYVKIDFNSIIDTQKKILKNASFYLKPGGILVYSTCTLNRDENEEVVKWFLENHKGFTTEEIKIGKLLSFMYNKYDIGITILPSKNLDGFYISKIRKCDA